MTKSKKATTLPVITAAILLVVVLAILCSYQLRVNHVAVVTTLGKPTLVVKPGFHLRFPWPVQQVLKLDQRNQVLVGSLREIPTQDNINLVIRLFVTWKVDDPLLYFNRVGNIYEAETLLKSLMESKQEAVIRNHVIADILTTKTTKSKLQDIEEEIRYHMDQQAKDYGVAISFVGFSQLGLHESNTKSILKRMKQEQAQLAAQIRSRSEKESTIIRDNADSLKEQHIAKAKANAKRIRGEATVKAAEQYEHFKNDLEFAIFLRKLDALEETTKSKTTVILGPNTPPYDLLLHPSSNKVYLK